MNNEENMKNLPKMFNYPFTVALNENSFDYEALKVSTFCQHCIQFYCRRSVSNLFLNLFQTSRFFVTFSIIFCFKQNQFQQKNDYHCMTLLKHTFILTQGLSRHTHILSLSLSLSLFNTHILVNISRRTKA